MNAVWTDFKGWMAQPYKTDMTAFQWAMFIGLLLVILALWRVVFIHVEEGLS